MDYVAFLHPGGVLHHLTRTTSFYHQKPSTQLFEYLLVTATDLVHQVTVNICELEILQAFSSVLELQQITHKPAYD